MKAEDFDKQMDATIDHVTSPDGLKEDGAEIRSIAESASKDKKEKFVRLYQARSILLAIGTMAERREAKKNLKMMKRKGIQSV